MLLKSYTDIKISFLGIIETIFLEFLTSGNSEILLWEVLTEQIAQVEKFEDSLTNWRKGL